MKKIFSLAMFATVLFYSNEANAKIRRVGYFGTPVSGKDYATLQSAYDAASANDTIMLFPGSWDANISKKIVVLGYGYFITGDKSNSNLQNITKPLSANIDLYAGADGSVFEGIDNLTISPYYGQTVNKVIIRRCNTRLYFNDKNSDSWQILQCNINYLGDQYSTGKITNLKVSNSYIDYFGFEKVIGQTGQFENDVIDYGNFNNTSFIVKNCVIISSHSEDDNCVYQNSIATESYPIPLGNGNQNISYESMRNNVFVGYSDQNTYSNDKRWALKTGSPAKGKGAGGTDCGMFGGANPYKLSGIPRIPSFYKLSATSTTTSTNPYTITFSVRSNN